MKVFLVLLAIIVSLSSCFTYKQNIGKGIVLPMAKDTTKATAKVISVSKKRWYLLWGISPLNTVDTKKMAKGATNYTIKQRISISDMILSLPTAFFLSSQTVTVKKLAPANFPVKKPSPTSK